MASTYSSLKIQLMATGENSGTWGNVTNINLGTAIEEAIVGSADVPFSSADVTLTLTDSNSTQAARNLRLNLTGTSGGARQLIVPAIEKIYIINNGLADTVTVKNSTGNGIAVPAGKTMYVYNNGTDVVDAITHLTSLTLGTPLPVASGGTGSATGTFSGANITSLNASNISAGTLSNDRLDTVSVAKGGTGATTLNAEAVVVGNATGAVKFVAPGTNGNVLTSNGTAWVSQAVAAAAGGFSASQVFNSPGTFTPPPSTTKVYVMLQGGGGGGGGSGLNASAETRQPGGLGAGGGFAIGVVSVTGGSSITVTAGGGGAGGNSSPNNANASGNAGGTGGASSFGNLISANGGGGGNGGNSFPPNVGNPGSGGNGVSPTGLAISGAVPSAIGITAEAGLTGKGAGGFSSSSTAAAGSGIAGYVFVAY